MGSQSIGADGGYKNIILKSPPGWDGMKFTRERKVKSGVTVYPGYLVSGNGETEGEVDLAAAGDGDTSYIEVVIKRIGAPLQGIDVGITAGQMVKTLENVKGFTVAALRADESSSLEQGCLMMLEATGMVKAFAYAGDATLKDIVGRLAASSADVADTDPAIELALGGA